MCGKVDDMWIHLSKCKDISTEERDQASQEVLYRDREKANKENARLTSEYASANPVPAPNSMSRPLTHSRTPSLGSVLGDSSLLNSASQLSTPAHHAQRQKTANSDDVPAEMFYAEVGVPRSTWTRENQEQFAADVCRLMIICNIAWWAVEQPYWREFFRKWTPGSLMPGRKELSGRILDEEAAKVVNRMKIKVKGKNATGQCDGWKNVSKTSLIGSMINVEYTVGSFESSIGNSNLTENVTAILAQHV